MSRKQTKFFAFSGGENLVDPVILMNAGELHGSMNYENRTSGGYRRIDGYERFDGQQSPSELSIADYADRDTWIAAVEAARDNIDEVPGSGPIRGVWVYNGTTYAFRDDAGATKGVMFKSTSSGWTQVEDSFPAGGKYDFVNYNFYGHSNSIAM